MSPVPAEKTSSCNQSLTKETQVQSVGRGSAQEATGTELVRGLGTWVDTG